MPALEVPTACYTRVSGVKQLALPLLGGVLRTLRSVASVLGVVFNLLYSYFLAIRTSIASSPTDCCHFGHFGVPFSCHFAPVCRPFEKHASYSYVGDNSYHNTGRHPTRNRFPNPWGVLCFHTVQNILAFVITHH